MSTTSSTKPTPSSNDESNARLNDLGGAAAKDLRACEHARHRTKERQEHALAKERKEKAATVRALGLKVVRGTKPMRKLSMESWDGDVPKKQQQQQPVKPLVASAAPPLPQTPLSPQSDPGSPFTELTLGDFISKPRQPKAKQLDFEMIPPVRAVIALDDADADEPWEYITRASLSDGFAWKGKSYAQAVASAM